MRILFLILSFIFYSILFGNENQIDKPAISTVQVKLDLQNWEKVKKENNVNFDPKVTPSNDSIVNKLRYKNPYLDSCLDRNCYITKKEFNTCLGSLNITTKNIDSIRTVVLFQILTEKFVTEQAKNIQLDSTLEEKNCDKSKSNVYSYKLRLLTSTDSANLTSIIDSFSNKVSLFAKPVELIFHNLKGDDSIIADIFFSLKAACLDFRIPEKVLDSTKLNKWSLPVRASFGFYSYFLIEKDTCKPEYIDLRDDILYFRSSYRNEPNKKSDSIVEFDFYNEDTLIVKFWLKPAILSDSGKMVLIDTTNLPSTIIDDTKLPGSIRNIIREHYFKKGLTYFNNFRTVHGLWCLKIEKYIESKKKRVIPINYQIAKYLLSYDEMMGSKLNEKIETEKNNLYRNSIAEKIREKIPSTNDSLTAITELYRLTDHQIEKSAFQWIANEVSFYDNIFFKRYLPEEITEN